MKATSLLAIFLIVFLFGCDKIEEAKQFDTTFDVQQTVSVSGQAMETKSAQVTGAAYGFDASKDLNLADNQDVKDYLNKLKSIEINSASVTFSNIQSGQTILTISVKIDGTEVYSGANINTASTFAPDISANELDFIAKQLEKNKKMTINVSGTTNTPSMTFMVDHKFNATITAKLL